jgi:hypothetical protein
MRGWLALATLAGACAADRVPAWSGADPPPSRVDELVQASRQARRRAAHLDGRRRYARLDEAVADAERALAARNPELRARAARRRPPVEVFAAATRDDLPALTAYAESLLAWSEARGLATLLVEAARIEAAARRAAEIDRSAGFGAPDRVLAMLSASLPLDAGGDLAQALERFEMALAAAPDYLPTRVAFAERYAARLGDRALYRRLLDEVLHADAAALPDALAENLEAQATARRLLAAW